jgi:hypothetical protein
MPLQLATREQQLAEQAELLRQVGEKASLQKATTDTIRELSASKERDLLARLHEVRGCWGKVLGLGRSAGSEAACLAVFVFMEEDSPLAARCQQ